MGKRPIFRRLAFRGNISDMYCKDLEANMARDKHARLVTQVESLVSSLKTSQSEETLAEISDQLVSGTAYSNS
jgi:hypothetical protein